MVVRTQRVQTFVLAVAFVCALLVLCPAPVVSQVKAFPSAEGYGANALGGRGGKAYNINSLAAGSGSAGSCNSGGCGGSAPFTSGSVTLGDCLADRFGVGARSCIFRVGGTINWTIEYPTSFSYLTIAGQTA
jgi:pectate lyase